MIATKRADCVSALRAACVAALSAGSTSVCLVIRRTAPPRGRTIRIAKHCGPRGTVLNAKEFRDDNGTHAFDIVARFDAAAVADFVNRVLTERDSNNEHIAKR